MTVIVLIEVILTLIDNKESRERLWSASKAADNNANTIIMKKIEYTSQSGW